MTFFLNISAAQCLEVGRHAYSQGDFEQSEEWFRVAYDRLFDELEQKKEVDAQGTTIASDETEENGETEPTVGQILDYLAYSLGRVSESCSFNLFKFYTENLFLIIRLLRYFYCFT